MKTVRTNKGKVIRMTDDEAFDLVDRRGKGQYVPKSEYKKRKKK